jgi:hypothetical protein
MKSELELARKEYTEFSLESNGIREFDTENG